MIKAIIFDWAGVIGAEGYWIWLGENIKNLEERRSSFLEISDRVDIGEMSHNEFMAMLSRETGKSQEQIWKEIKSKIIINKELVSFVKALKPKYKIALLTNYTYPWLEELMTENDQWGLFDERIISSEYKIIKPYREIFEKMLGMLNVKPEEAIFVDDRQINVDGAEKVGIHGLLFENNEKFIKDLKKLGV